VKYLMEEEKTRVKEKEKPGKVWKINKKELMKT
jgi:hypothetical protein